MEAAARLMPKSAWTCGITTEDTYMPLEPNVMSSKVMNKRQAACLESMADAGAGGSGENKPMVDEGQVALRGVGPVYRDVAASAIRVCPQGGAR